MDNTAQKPPVPMQSGSQQDSQSADSAPAQEVQAAPPAQDPQQQPSVQTPVSAAGTMHKEAGLPLPTTELIRPTEVEPIIPPEVAEYGVEAVKDHEKPELSLEDKKGGLEPAKEAVPVPTQPSGLITLPMTQAQAMQTLKKTKSVSESVAWLAVLVIKHLRQMHQKIAK